MIKFCVQFTNVRWKPSYYSGIYWSNFVTYTKEQKSIFIDLTQNSIRKIVLTLKIKARLKINKIYKWWFLNTIWKYLVTSLNFIFKNKTCLYLEWFKWGPSEAGNFLRLLSMMKSFRSKKPPNLTLLFINFYLAKPDLIKLPNLNSLANMINSLETYLTMHTYPHDTISTPSQLMVIIHTRMF